MIYLKDLGLRYYPIAKVASTSVKKALLHANGITVQANREVHPMVRNENHYVISNGVVQRVNELQEESGFGFALVRNPFDRLVSAYINKVVQQNIGLPTRFYEAREFSQFVDILLEEEPTARMDGHIRPQYFSLDGRKLDLIARLEEIEPAWRRITEIAGKDIHLPFTNRSIGRTDYRAYYTPQLVERVAHYYAVDLERYDYTF